MPLQIRRGPTVDRLATVPLVGELVYDTTTGAVFVGNGVTVGGEPVTSFSVADARTTTAKMFLGEDLSDNSLHSGITFQYVANRLIATVENIDLDGTVITSIIPTTDAEYDLGSPTNRWRDLYLNGSSLYLGEAVITSNTDGSVNLPAGTLVGGLPIGLDLGQTYEVNIIGDVISSSSGVIVNSVTNDINANIVSAAEFRGVMRGEVIGSVFADNSTQLVNAVDGTIPAEVVDGTFTGDVVGTFQGQLTTTGNSLFGNSSFAADFQVTSSGGTYPLFIRDVSPLSSVTESAAIFRLNSAFDLVDSGPELEFQVSATALPGLNPTLAKISTKMILDAQARLPENFGSMELQTNNGLSFFTNVQMAENITVLNGKISFFKNSITNIITDVIDVLDVPQDLVNDYDNGDINILPETEVVNVFGDLIPGTYGDSTGSRFSLGSNSLKWETVHSESVRAYNFVKFPVYADTTARDTALPNGVVEAGMVVFITASTQLQVNTDSTVGGWVNLN
jgi:hypothetical protein